MKTLTVILLTSLCLLAQSVEVYDLTPAESAEGRRLYKAMTQSKADYEKWADEKSEKYIKQKNCASKLCYKGEFDKEFNHIVPALPPSVVPSNGWSITPYNGITTPYSNGTIQQLGNGFGVPL